jgi:hypothetical protein
MEKIMKNKCSAFDCVIDIALYVFLIGIGIYLFCSISSEFPYRIWTDYVFYEAVFFVAWGSIALIVESVGIIKRRR